MFSEKKKEDFYQHLRFKIKKYIEENPNSKYLNYLILIPDIFHLLCKLFVDPEVTIINKAILGGAIAYFISPIDLIPDFIPIVGSMDDLAFAVFSLNKIINSTDRNQG